jgi:uncharacterized membrane protein YcfT
MELHKQPLWGHIPMLLQTFSTSLGLVHKSVPVSVWARALTEHIWEILFDRGVCCMWSWTSSMKTRLRLAADRVTT